MRWLGWFLLAVVWSGTVGFAAVYGLTSGMLPYHQAAIGLPADAMPTGLLALYGAMMKVIAAFAAGLSLLAAYVLVGPVRAGSRLAVDVLAASFVLVQAALFTIARHVDLTTPADPPYAFAGVAVAATVLGWALLRFAPAPRS